MAIIGINGYSGSGKDTIGMIIQRMTSKERYGYLENTWEIKKWAGKLKQVVSLLTGIPVYKLEDQEFKKTNLGSEWSTWQPYESNASWIGDKEGIEFPMTVRSLLQKVGTEALRNNVHQNVWVNALMADYIGMYDLDTDRTTYPNWVITDTRFSNEAEAIKKAGGIIIRVDRPGVGPLNNHISETSLDDWDFDYKIANVSDIDALAYSVNIILQKEKLL